MDTLIMVTLFWPISFTILAIVAYKRPDAFPYDGHKAINDPKRYIRRNGMSLNWVDLSPEEWEDALKKAPKLYLSNALFLVFFNTLVLILFLKVIILQQLAETIMIICGGISFPCVNWIIFKKRSKF